MNMSPWSDLWNQNKNHQKKKLKIWSLYLRILRMSRVWVVAVQAPDLCWYPHRDVWSKYWDHSYASTLQASHLSFGSEFSSRTWRRWRLREPFCVDLTGSELDHQEERKNLSSSLLFSLNSLSNIWSNQIMGCGGEERREGGVEKTSGGKKGALDLSHAHPHTLLLFYPTKLFPPCPKHSLTP